MSRRLLALLPLVLVPSVALGAPTTPEVPIQRVEPATPTPTETPPGEVAAPSTERPPAPEAVESPAAPSASAPEPSPVEPRAEAVPLAPAAPAAAPPEVSSPAPITEPAEPAPIAAPPDYDPPPSRDRALAPPRFRGTGLFVAAGIVGGVGAGIKLTGTIRAIHIVDTGGGDGCFGWGNCGFSTMMGHSVFGTPLLTIGAGLLGGGMGMLGRYRAHDELFGNAPRDKKPTRTMPLREGLGWGLFGGGVGLWAASRAIGAFACQTEACLVGTWESTFYVSGAMIAAGMVLGPYASAHRRYHKRFGKLASQLSMTPVVSPTFSGLSLGGRF
ncbi:MAG: hypothetical protein AB1Z98_16325 [Nannocystaceae bacterium]